MLTTTHLLIAVMIGLVLNLNRDEWFAAITFGVFVDADHLFALPRYVSDNGLAAVLRPTWDDGSGLPWRSVFHEPMGAFVTFPLGIGWRWLTPFLFWGAHVAADELQMALLEYNTPVESALVVISGAGILYIYYSRWAEVREEASWGGFIQYVRSKARAAIS